jgi:hypothetical protein
MNALITFVIPSINRPSLMRCLLSLEHHQKRWRQFNRHTSKRNHAASTALKRKSAFCDCICFREKPSQRFVNQKGFTPPCSTTGNARSSRTVRPLSVPPEPRPKAPRRRKKLKPWNPGSNARTRSSLKSWRTLSAQKSRLGKAERSLGAS